MDYTKKSIYIIDQLDKKNHKKLNRDVYFPAQFNFISIPLGGGRLKNMNTPAKKINGKRDKM